VDLLAALGLAMVLEGLALTVFAKSMPELLAELSAIGPERLRLAGVAALLAGGALYLVVRGA